MPKPLRTFGISVLMTVGLIAPGCGAGQQLASGASENDASRERTSEGSPGTREGPEGHRRGYPDAIHIVPTRDQLPTFATDADLEFEASLIPDGDRRLFGSDEQGPTGWTAPIHARGDHAFPVFGFDGALLGIFVSNVGIVPRAEYDDPDFDPEMAAIARLGEDEYWRRVHVVYCIHQFVERTGETPDPEVDDVSCDPPG